MTSSKVQEFFNNMDNEELRSGFSVKGNPPVLCIWCGYPFLIGYKRAGKAPALTATKEHLLDHRKAGRELAERKENVVWAHARCNHYRAHSEWLPYYMHGPRTLRQHQARQMVLGEFIYLAKLGDKMGWTLEKGIDDFLRAAILERQKERSNARPKAKR